MKTRAIERFAGLRAGLGRPGSDVWARRSDEAFAKFEAAGLPTPASEAWKHTDLSPIADTPFAVPRDGAGRLSYEILAPFLPPGWERSPRIVFVNGRLSGALSSLADLPEGLSIRPLAEALAREPGLWEESPSPAPGESPFAALNGAFFRDGALVQLRPGASPSVPVYVVNLSVPEPEPFLTFPRTLILAGESARLNVVEVFSGVGRGAYFTNARTELNLGPDASVEQVRLQAETEDAYHISTVAVRQDRASRYASHNISLGAALARSDWHVLLEREGGECSLGGLYVGRGAQHADNHTVIDHAAPHCTSRELYKGVLDDRARGVFFGRLVVRPDAQKTDARQTNNNLLLSEDALADTTPQLEIRADDVRCAHGATIGKLDEDALFYLRSRGIEYGDARSLLVQAFVREVLDAVGVPAARDHVERLLEGRF